MVLSATFTKEIVVGFRTDSHQVISVERTAIAANNKGLYKMMSISADQTPSQKHLCCLQNGLPLQQWGCLQKEKLPSQSDRYYKCRHCKLAVWRRNFICNEDVSVCRKMLSKERWNFTAEQNS